MPSLLFSLDVFSLFHLITCTPWYKSWTATSNGGRCTFAYSVSFTSLHPHSLERLSNQVTPTSVVGVYSSILKILILSKKEVIDDLSFSFNF